MNDFSKDNARMLAVMTAVVAVLIALAVMLPSASADGSPKIEMGVNDTFAYGPTTTMPSEITAYGTAVIGSPAAAEGAFLVWDASSGVLSGTAVKEGTYTATVYAVWSEGDLRQEAYQVIEFTVGASSGAGTAYDLTYDSMDSEWTLITTPVSSSDGGSGGSPSQFGTVDVLCSAFACVGILSFALYRNVYTGVLAAAGVVLAALALTGVF